MEPLEFEWDERKNASNKRKHRISVEQATAVFRDPARIGWLRSDPGDDEERYMVAGREAWRIVPLVDTMRGNSYRLISARKANQDERRAYDRSQNYP